MTSPPSRRSSPRAPPALPKRLTQIASFALENPDEIAFGTVSSIAEQAEVQPSALVRFSQALGYQGFSDMQEIFRSRLRDRILNYDERLQQLREHAPETSKPNVILHGFCEASARSIAALQEKLDPADLDRAVEQLARAETIYLIGLRRSFPIASYMAYALGKLGVRAILVDAVGGLAAEQITFAGPKDAVLAISFTPYASETVSLARAAAARKRSHRVGHRQPVFAAGPAGRAVDRDFGGQFRGFPLHGGNPDAGHDADRGDCRAARPGAAAGKLNSRA